MKSSRKASPPVRTIAQLMDLSGRKAAILGGAGHIGSVAAAGLIELGAQVALLDRELANCRKQAAGLKRIRKGSSLALHCDLSSESATRRSIRAAIREMGGLDILVHCPLYIARPKHRAGWIGPFSKQTAAAFNEAAVLHMTSAFVAVQEARESLAAARRGSVVLFSSIYGMAGPDLSLYKGTKMANPLGYGATKGGLLQMTRSLATTLAPAIRVNAVSPGGVRRGQPRAFVRRYKQRTPLGRMATEEDLKGAVAYLAGDLSAYVTGQNLAVDGGWTAW